MILLLGTIVAPNWQDLIVLAIVVSAVAYLIGRQLGKRRSGKTCSSGDCKCAAKKLVRDPIAPN